MQGGYSSGQGRGLVRESNGITSAGVSRTKRVGLVLISLPCLSVPGQPCHTRVSHRQPFAFTTLLPHTTPINPNTHADFSKHTCKYGTHALLLTYTYHNVHHMYMPVIVRCFPETYTPIFLKMYNQRQQDGAVNKVTFCQPYLPKFAPHMTDPILKLSSVSHICKVVSVYSPADIHKRNKMC